MEYLFIALLVLAIPVAGVAGFFMALNLRARTLALETRLATLELRFAGPPPAAEAPPGAEAAPVAEVAPPVLVSEPEPVLGPEPEAVPEPAAAPVPPPPPVPPARPGLEERLGTRWAVWVGGIALALGGLFLVRYSIEQGLIGPAARIAAGAVFALALVGAGEWMRRRDVAPSFAALPSAHIPSILTAAGTSTAFATVYAAYGLYGMVGPGGAFVMLGAIALLTMAAATLQGPALAGLGLVAALGAPLLVQSDSPQPWVLVLYLLFVAFAAYGVARLRLWRWLALAGAVGVLLWTVPIALVGGSDVLPVAVHLLLQTGLAGLFLVAEPHRGTPDSEARLDRFAAPVLLAFAGLAVMVSGSWHLGGGRPVFAGAMALTLLGLALRFAPAAAAAVWAALVAAGALALWPVEGEAAREQLSVVPDLLVGSPRPAALGPYLAFAVAVPLAIAAASLLRLATGRSLPVALAAWYAAAATLAPLAALVVAYWRVADLDRSVSFAAVAGVVALGFVFAAARLRPLDGAAARLGLGATAAAAVAALALGLTFALEKGMLTVAFALAALGTAWVSDRLALRELRPVVAAVGLLVLGRILWDPTIAGDDLGRTPILNWLLWGYGVPALAFWQAARLLERAGRDRIVRFAESLAILFAALLAVFQIRHLLQGGDPLAPTSDHLEMGLVATVGLLFAWVMVRAQSRTPDVLYRTASLVFGGITLAIAFFFLALGTNPLLKGEEVLGGPVLNSLLLAYLLPALAAAALARAARGVRPEWYVRAAAGLALALQLLWTVAAIRRLFQGPVIDLNLPTGQGEMWSYSLALLAIGTVLLAAGLLRDSRLLRQVSAAYILVAVFKVFVIDLSNLEGVTRALSFIGLGLALVGIGLAYQKLLIRREPPPGPEAPAAAA